MHQPNFRSVPTRETPPPLPHPPKSVPQLDSLGLDSNLDADQVVIALRSGWIADALLPLYRMISSRRTIIVGTNRRRLVLLPEIYLSIRFS